MPFIHTKVNVPISHETEEKLNHALGQAITLLNKSEAWLMLQFEDNCHLYFKGDCQKPLAVVTVSLLGSSGETAYSAMTTRITDILAEELHIPRDGVYVIYSETDTWGWNGQNL